MHRILRYSSGFCNSFLAASFRSRSQRKEFYDFQTKGNSSLLSKRKASDSFDPLLPLDESNSTSSTSTKSFGDTQLEIFNYQHGLLILHLLAVLMFMPSLIAWFQRIGTSQSFPWFMDSVLCVGVILHGLCGSRPDTSSLSIHVIPGHEFGLSFVYLLCGCYSFLSALSSTPYRSLYAMASIGVISLAFRIIDKRKGEKGDGQFRNSRRHSHKH